MFRLLTILTASALLLTGSPASAAPRPEDKGSGPAIVGQAKSFNELLDITKAMVRNVGGDAIYKEFEKHVLPDLDPKRLPGIDPKRPFGLYGVIDAELSKCRGVLLIPVTSQKDFLDMLEAKLINVNKGKEEGTFDIVVPPDFPIPVSMRIHKEYAYIGIGGFDVLDPKVILDPKDVINDKEKAVAYIALRLDRVPAEAKKFLLAALRDQTDHLKEMIQEPELKDAFFSMQKLTLRWLKTLFDEGKELAIRLDANSKTGEVFTEITVEGMPKSPLAAEIAKRPPTKNAFASVPGNDYAQRIFVSAPLFAEEAKEALIKLIEYGQKEAVQEAARGAPAEVVSLVEAVFKSLKATVESGEMDLAAALRGPNKDGFYTAVGAVHCKEGAQLEKAIKEAVKKAPGQISGFFKFDAQKIGELTVHEIDLTSIAEEPAKKIFGEGQKAYFAFGKDALYASYGPDGMKLLKEAIAAKPGPAPAFDSTADGKKVADIMKKLIPQNAKGPQIRLGWSETVTSGLQVTLEGGDRLKVRVSLNLTMLMMGLGGWAESTQGGVAPAAVPAKN
ncbi:MAG TPA: hypothetical protein VKD71_05885 [Gemmataceae bacterium]|nr:hypothetical protein [Gemmataceae bacterium]